MTISPAPLALLLFNNVCLCLAKLRAVRDGGHVRRRR